MTSSFLTTCVNLNSKSCQLFHQHFLNYILSVPPGLALVKTPTISQRLTCLPLSDFNSIVSPPTEKFFVFSTQAMPFQALAYFNACSSFFNVLHHLLYRVNTSTPLKTLPKSHILCEASLILSGSFQSAPYIPIQSPLPLDSSPTMKSICLSILLLH